MRIVDFHAFPDRAEFREELVHAFAELDPGDAEQVEPIDDASALGVGFDDELDDDALRDAARDLRAQLESIVSEDMTVRFDLADAEADADGGAPDHLE